MPDSRSWAPRRFGTPRWLWWEKQWHRPWCCLSPGWGVGSSRCTAGSRRSSKRRYPWCRSWPSSPIPPASCAQGPRRASATWRSESPATKWEVWSSPKIKLRDVTHLDIVEVDLLARRAVLRHQPDDLVDVCVVGRMIRVLFQSGGFTVVLGTDSIG